MEKGECMKDKILKLFKSQAILSLFYIILGFCLIIMPVTMVNIICKIVFGIVLMATGVYHILIYVNEKKNSTLLDLCSGVLVLVLGGFLFFNPQVVVKLLPVLMGVFVIVDSIWVLQGCLQFKKNKRMEWKIFTFISFLFILLSLVLIINPFNKVNITIIFAGIVLLCNGMADLVFLFFQKRKPKQYGTDPEHDSVTKEESEETVQQKGVAEETSGKQGQEEAKDDSTEIIPDGSLSSLKDKNDVNNNEVTENQVPEKNEEESSWKDETLEEWKD